MPEPIEPSNVSRGGGEIPNLKPDPLAALPALPRVHMYWPNTPDDQYAQVSRICRSASVNITHEYNEAHLTRAVETGQPVVLWMSPKSYEHVANDLLPRAKRVHDYGQPIYRINIDSEAIHRNQGWSAVKALWEMHELLVRELDDLFPGVKCNWYGKNGSQISNNSLGWQEDNNTIGFEPGPASVSLYWGPEFGMQQRLLDTTVMRSGERGMGTEVTVWISVGGCYQRTKQHESGKFSFDTPEYTVDHAWIWGRRLNNNWYSRQDVARFGRLESVNDIIFYPSPMDPRCGLAGEERFVAYVNGANGIF